MDEQFSQETKNIIAESRAIALSLGYDYITTVHFFMADCKRNHVYSIRKFIFESEEALNKFINSQRVDQPFITEDNVPLTMEAERTIHRAIRLRKYYKDNQVHPYHFFLAAAELKDTLFHSAIKPSDDLYKRLEKYYVDLGGIKPKQTLIDKIKKIFLML
jgi:ATP-dependent Clp protease ATP-binding subunit ClpA